MQGIEPRSLVLTYVVELTSHEAEGRLGNDWMKMAKFWNDSNEEIAVETFFGRERRIAAR